MNGDSRGKRPGKGDCRVGEENEDQFGHRVDTRSFNSYPIVLFFG